MNAGLSKKITDLSPVAYMVPYLPVSSQQSTRAKIVPPGERKSNLLGLNSTAIRVFTASGNYIKFAG